MEVGLAEVAELHPDGGLVKSARGTRFHHGKRPAKGGEPCGCQTFRAFRATRVRNVPLSNAEGRPPLAEEASSPVELQLSCLRRGSRHAPIQLRLR